MFVHESSCRFLFLFTTSVIGMDKNYNAVQNSPQHYYTLVLVVGEMLMGCCWVDDATWRFEFSLLSPSSPLSLQGRSCCCGNSLLLVVVPMAFVPLGQICDEEMFLKNDNQSSCFFSASVFFFFLREMSDIEGTCGCFVVVRKFENMKQTICRNIMLWNA